MEVPELRVRAITAATGRERAPVRVAVVAVLVRPEQTRPASTRAAQAAPVQRGQLTQRSMREAVAEVALITALIPALVALAVVAHLPHPVRLARLIVAAAAVRVTHLQERDRQAALEAAASSSSAFPTHSRPPSLVV